MSRDNKSLPNPFRKDTVVEGEVVEGVGEENGHTAESPDSAETKAIPATSSAETMPLPDSLSHAPLDSPPEADLRPRPATPPAETIPMPSTMPLPSGTPLTETVRLPNRAGEEPIQPEVDDDPDRTRLIPRMPESSRPAARVPTMRSTQVAADCPPLAVLVPIEGELLGALYPIYEGETAMGRSDSNQLVLSSAKISRLQAKIVHRRRSFTLYALSENNPTFLNDKELRRPTTIRDGATIRMGRTIFRFRTIDPL